MYQNNPQIAEYSDVLDFLFAINKNMTQVIDSIEVPAGKDENTELDIWEELQMEDN